MKRRLKTEELQELLLGIVQTWDLDPYPEYRGFRCAQCQTYMDKGAWHYWLTKGGYITPVHFCDLCQEELKSLGKRKIDKPKTGIDRDSFGLDYDSVLRERFDKIIKSWGIEKEGNYKQFTCDQCGQPFPDAKGYHVWHNKEGTLVEFHFDKGCAIELGIDRYEKVKKTGNNIKEIDR